MLPLTSSNKVIIEVESTNSTRLQSIPKPLKTPKHLTAHASTPNSLRAIKIFDESPKPTYESLQIGDSLMLAQPNNIVSNTKLPTTTP